MQFHISFEQLDQFAFEFWNYVKDASVFAFHGKMGAGKTTIITALCRKLGVREAMASPTFSIINEYTFTDRETVKQIYHIDLYRLKDEEEVVQAGIEDCIYSGSICMVEWPEKAPGLFDERTVHVLIQPLSETERSIDIKLPLSFSLVSENNRNL